MNAPIPSGQKELEADIEATRERLGETVEELAHRLDVKAQVHDKVDETKQAVSDVLAGTKVALAAKKDVLAGKRDALIGVLSKTERFRGAATEAAKRRDVQVAAGAAVLSGFVGAVLLRRG